jgi:hypothetical protein
MRHEDRPGTEDADAVGFNFHFQIANGAGRKACSVRVQAQTFHDATGVLRENWPTIELMARESLAAADGAEIRLTMPPAPIIYAHGYDPISSDPTQWTTGI